MHIQTRQQQSEDPGNPHKQFFQNKESGYMPNTKKIVPLVVLALLASVALISCRHNPVGVDTQPIVCFKTDVLPVIQSNCGKSNCHAGSGRGGSRLNLATEAGIMKGIIPYQPLSSSIYSKIIDGSMPPSPNYPLTEDQRTAIYLWILQGADTTCVTQ